MNLTLAMLIFLLAVLMSGLSLVQRRTDRFEPTLTGVIRVLIVAILGLTTYYFIVAVLA
ncbi:MAG: hypothetical protein WBF53_09185 [Litorimonas sp.]